jgi:anthranilate phosphoribosyltransferase
MSYAHYIKEIGRGAEGARNLSRDDACQLYAAMLDGGVPDLELGAIILGLRVKGESLDEMLGFLEPSINVPTASTCHTGGCVPSFCRPITGRARKPI